MLRPTIVPCWTTRLFLSANAGKLALVKPLAVGISGRMRFFSSPPIIKSRRCPDDEAIYQANYSDALDESDALELGKRKRPNEIVANENEDKSKTTWTSRLIERLTFWKKHHFSKGLFSSDWLLHQPRGDAFAPFFFGGRDPFVFHDTFLPVLLARQHHQPLPPEVLDLPLGYDIQEKKTQDKGQDNNSYYEMTLEIPKQIEDLTIQVEEEKKKKKKKKDGPASAILHVEGRRSNRKVKSKWSTNNKGLDERLLIPLSFDVDMDHIQAKFLSEERVLVLMLPKKLTTKDDAKVGLRNHQNMGYKFIPIRTVPELHPEAAYDDYLLQTTFCDAFDESDWAETGKRQHVAC